MRKHLDVINTDFLIVGAGIIGLCIAREIKKKYRDCKVTVIDKEKSVGEHASGRNSGVLHAGFYYTKDSLKAKFTREGNKALTEYCLDNKIAINRCGKLVVTRSHAELTGLYELLERAKTNNIDLQLLSEQDAKEIEPRVRTIEKALFSPSTSSVSPKEVVEKILADTIREDVTVLFCTKYLKTSGKKIMTNRGIFECGHIINCAGLYADHIAKDFGFSENYTILPFKGLYLDATNPKEKLNTHIYPVPNLANPFLGVHFTITVDGHVKIGPTAIPALWREQYKGLSRINPRELLAICGAQAGLIFNAGFDFRRLAVQELLKYRRKTLSKHAGELISGVESNNYLKWGKPGIRAQLLNVKTKTLMMDFIIEGDSRSTHVLNAVSPAFTCSIPFSQYVVDHLIAV